MFRFTIKNKVNNYWVYFENQNAIGCIWNKRIYDKKNNKVYFERSNGYMY